MILSAERRTQLTLKARALTANLNGRAEAYLASRGITREAAGVFMLGVADRGEFAGRLSIPYLTPGGVVAIKYRAMDGSAPKYLNESGCGIHLYNAQVLIHAADRVVLTEGEMDAITVQAYTGLPAVAYPGVDTWGKERHWRLCFQDAAEVVVVADGDKPGRDAAKRVADSIGSHARVVNMPGNEGMDANQFIAEQGASAFLERINNG